MFRIIVARGESAHHAQASHRDRYDDRLAAARQHHIRLAAADHFGGLADRIGACGAGSHHRHIRPAQTQENGDHPGGGIRQHHRHGERADPRWTAFEIHLHLLEERPQPANAGTDHHTDPVADTLIHLQT